MPEIAKTRFSQDERVEVMSIRQGDQEFHSHEFLEMVYITNGQALHSIDREDTVVKKGDYFIIDYGSRHKYTLIDGKQFDLINILFKPELIDRSLKNCRSFQELINHYLIHVSYSLLDKKPVDTIYHDADSEVYGVIKKICREYDEKSPGYIELVRCHIIEIIIMTIRTISENSGEVFTDGVSDFITGYIDANYMNKISLTQLSRRLNFSPQHICRKFRQDTGYTFVEYLQRKRMEQGGRLIINTNKKISEIAELTGYSDVKFFNSVFKKYWQMTPGEFRKKYK